MSYEEYTRTNRQRNYEDEGYDNVRTNTTTRRYRPIEPTTQRPPTRVPQRTSAQPAPRTRPVHQTVDYNPVPVTIEHVKDRTGRKHMIVSPREERYTDDDDQIRPLQVTHKGQKKISRRTIGRILLVSGVAALAGWTGMQYGVAHSTTTNGNPIYIECGHDDSPLHKTELRAYVDPQEGCAVLLEIAGGDYSKAVATRFPTFASFGYTGDLNQVDITIDPQQIGLKHYELIVTLTCRDVPFLHAPVVKNFVFVNDAKNKHFIFG